MKNMLKIVREIKNYEPKTYEGKYREYKTWFEAAAVADF